MSRKMTSIQVFLASPSDLEEERNTITEAIKELNTMLPQQSGAFIDLLKWETHTYPTIGSSPQAIVNKQIDDYDILITVFWTKVGTPTDKYKSGTIEEFENAYKKWQKDNNSVQLMVYFKIAPIAPDKIDPQQLKDVQEFKNSLTERGILYSNFTNYEDLSQLIRVHLSRQIQNILMKEKKDSADISSNEEMSIEVISPIIQDEEEGFLDLIEKIVASAERTSNVFSKISSSINQLNVDTNETTEEMRLIGNINNGNITKYKYAANKQADNMTDCVKRIESEIPIMEDSFSTLLSSTGRLFMIIKDFGNTPENLQQLEGVLNAVIELRNTIQPSREGAAKLKIVISATPRITTKYNHAKHDLIALFEKLTAIYDRELNMMTEIIEIGNTVKSTW